MNDNNIKIQEIFKARGLNPEMAEPVSENIAPGYAPAQKLMETYYILKNSIDMEVPYWYNRVWQENVGEITEVRRARAMAAALSHSTPTIQPGERLVMQKARNVRGAFPFPWNTASFFNAEAEALMNEVDAPPRSLADEISIVGAGGGNVTESYGNIIAIAKKFGLRKEEVPALVKVSKDWDGCSVEELSTKYSKMMPDYDLFESIMTSALCMFDSFAIPQGREVINYYYPLQFGWDGIIKLCEDRIAELMGNAGTDGDFGMSQAYYYVATKEIAKGMSQWCQNYADRAEYLASVETDPEQKAIYEEIHEVMGHVAHRAPQTFREALQITLCCHYGVVNEDPMSGMSIGRIGQCLQPFYEKDLADGTTTEEEVINLLELYRVKITCIECFASAGVTGGVLSGNTFNNLSLGGQAIDGTTAVVPLEYLIIEAGMRTKTPQPTLSVLYDEKTPEDFLIKAATCTKLGYGYPAWMNNQQGMNFMLNQYGAEGMNLEDARAWCLGGCLESSPGCFLPLVYNGKTTYIPGGAAPTAGSGVHFIAMPKVLELVLTNGVDERSGIQVLPAHNVELSTFDAVYSQWKAYMELITGVVLKANNLQMDIWRKQNMPVVASMLKPDCLVTGKHIGTMGCRYNATFNFESCGTITLVNSLAALKKIVYDDKTCSLEELKTAMFDNFGFKTAYETGMFAPDYKENVEGYDGKYDAIYAACKQAPKYGNDIPYVDAFLADYVHYMTTMLKNYTSYYGTPLYLCQISVSTHGPQGFITLATPDGRLAGTTYPDGSVSAAPGTDENGLYALFTSATVCDHSKAQNAQMNLKLHPSAVKGTNGTKKLLEIIRTYMRKGGFHVQFNVVDSKVLIDAQAKPDQYRDLLVRVAGFTQYWCEIGKPIQDEVICRTEHESA